MRNVPRLVMSVAVVLGAVACSSSGDPGCGEGFVGRTETHDATSADTREQALHAALEDLGFEASDEAITEAVVNAIPAASPPGHETVSVRTSDGLDVQMTLTPLDPGWAVHGSSWCEPG
jgi:hypothetical protein